MEERLSFSSYIFMTLLYHFVSTFLPSWRNQHLGLLYLANFYFLSNYLDWSCIFLYPAYIQRTTKLNQVTHIMVCNLEVKAAPLLHITKSQDPLSNNGTKTHEHRP